MLFAKARCIVKDTSEGMLADGSAPLAAVICFEGRVLVINLIIIDGKFMIFMIFLIL